VADTANLGDIVADTVGIGNPNPQAVLEVRGGRTGGFAQSVGWFENTNSTGNSAPALRVVTQGGNATDGALSVSANGTGLIARFGNYFSWVADIQTNGTIDALAFNPTSDRNAKEHFTPINARAVLEKVSALPISEWNYKVADGIRHLGPMAQDFQAAFGLGADDRHIATVDADGVALAAIQGLNEKVEAGSQKAAGRIQKLEAENADLKTRLEKLEYLLNHKMKGDNR
jgi:hypothetical protein